MSTIELCIEIAAPIERCFDLSRSIDLHLLGADQSGEEAVGGVTTGLIGHNQSVRWRARHFGIRQHLTSKITAFESPTYFQDTMTEGAFKCMQHDHYFSSASDGSTVMRDTFRFAAPIGFLGLFAEQLFLKRYMTRFLRHRNEILKHVAESEQWRNFLAH